MKTYVQPGNTITLTAPYAVASGDGLLVGSILLHSPTGRCRSPSPSRLRSSASSEPH